MIPRGDRVRTQVRGRAARRLHSMVNVGIIGVGAAWESRYLPALCRLGNRIRVRAVYDPVACRAEQVAGELGAAPETGMLALASRRDVQAILILDPAWYGVRAVRIVSTVRKPIYFANCLTADPGALEELRSLADAERLTLYPELAQRYTPASSRLQELLVTRLGRPRRIRIDTVSTSTERKPGETGLPPDLIALLDWCSYVVRRPPASITTQAPPPDASQTTRTIVLVYQPPKSGGDPPIAELHLADRNGKGEPHAEGTEPSVKYVIECERGTASLSCPDRISWCSETGPVDETLTADRPEVEVMLDQFCRRVVGGLIPAADIGDLCRGARLLRIAEESLRTGRAVPLSAELRNSG